jgi:hypothetical protein
LLHFKNDINLLNCVALIFKTKKVAKNFIISLQQHFDVFFNGKHQTTIFWAAKYRDFWPVMLV